MCRPRNAAGCKGEWPSQQHTPQAATRRHLRIAQPTFLAVFNDGQIHVCFGAYLSRPYHCRSPPGKQASGSSPRRKPCRGLSLEYQPQGSGMVAQQTWVSKDNRLTYYQVPALTGPKLSAPLTDSVDISYWLCGHYPKLLPPDHESTIRDMFRKLHDIPIFTLSARRDSMPPEWLANGIPPTAVDALLARPDSEISPQYRQALEKKRELYV